jgi:WD40 repeat protein
MESLVFSLDGKTLALGSNRGSFCLWSLDGKGSARLFGGHDGGVLAMWFSADGKRLASVGAWIASIYFRIASDGVLAPKTPEEADQHSSCNFASTFCLLAA